MASYQQQSPQDEGYSEDPLTGSTVSTSGPPWLASMTIPDRTEYVMSIISQLPTSQVAEIVRRLRPRLYINFFNYLPPEVCLKILGFLDPDSLVRTARASREWMSLALDRKLWEQLYILDGFRIVKSEVQAYEEAINADRSRPSTDSLNNDEHVRKRRATPQRILPLLNNDVDSDMPDVESPAHKQSSIFGPVVSSRLTEEPSQEGDIIMMSPRSPASSQSSKFSNRQNRYRDTMQARQNRRLSTQSSSSINSRNLQKSSLVVLDRSDNRKKLNWQYLYSQRRRLEQNWEKEKYVNFQLPHPNHPEEAHDECIYTIQHSGKYLVSGSRDRTLRIWDIDTQRLMRKPLRAHQGSVLCLQFDADPEEDLIVSGSSDATVILWKFSTGQVIQRLRKAHRESVLNVKFDKRVLVTCSKDKTIKIFNRRPMGPNDVGYPGIPGGVGPVPVFLNNYGFNPPPTAGLQTLPPYTMIGCLDGHGAAVNAVQIHGNEVISASGDRTVKMWNWTDQTCTRTYIGHTKGIACVQYDGRRIVSGSSDNEVKVFDKETALEVASLRAHKNLVRTVQAGFGDLPYSAEEDRADAKMIDREYFRAVETGEITESSNQKRGRPRNAGSRKPEHITAYGAKIPPGGGGGRFGRIVSGSYDETIIIWRRDTEGVWKAKHTLRQEEGALMASRSARRSAEVAVLEQTPAITPQQTQPVINNTPAITPAQPAPSPFALLVGNYTSDQPFDVGSSQWYRHLVDITLPQGPAALRELIRIHPHILTRSELSDAVQSMPADTQIQMCEVVANALEVQAQSLTLTTQPSASSSTTQTQTQTQSTILAPTTTTTTQLPPLPPSTTLPTGTLNPITTPIPTPAPAPTPVTQSAIHHTPSNMARVFKLQFDARRIICCSQTSVIVGWDFANGDEQLIEASRFFAPIE